MSSKVLMVTGKQTKKSEKTYSTNLDKENAINWTGKFLIPRIYFSCARF